MPWLVTKADICRRTGWTFSELDEQDESEVLPALLGQSMRDALQRVEAYVDTQGAARLAESDLAVYGDVIRTMSE